MKTKNQTVPRVEITKFQTQIDKVKIKDLDSAVNFCRNFYFDDINIFESFFIALVNNSNHTVGYAKISQGGICGTVADVRIIAHYAVNCLATGIILCHNHPSGNCIPSENDIKLTNRITNALQLLDVKVLDHIILTEFEHYSFAYNGLI